MIRYGEFNLNEYNADCAVVCDEVVSELYGYGAKVLSLSAGEQAKSFATAERVCFFLLQKNIDRSGKLIAVGGGSLTDLGAFCGAIYKRGVNTLLVPTTLLGMVDAAVGGKSALNVDQVKNAVGLFRDCDVLIDFKYLNTLSEEEMLNGFGEIVKYSFLSENIANRIDMSQWRKVDRQLVKMCIDYKSKVVARDFLDNGERRRLNLGHTIGHALELTRQLPHGVAVLNGLYYETLITLCYCVETDLARERMKSISQLIDVCQLGDVDDLVNVCLNDKKNSNGKICILYADGFNVKEKDFSEDELKGTLLRL